MPSPQIRDAMDVHINAYPFCPAPRGAQAEICHFGPHARQRHESVDGVGYVATVIVTEDERGGFDIFRLVVVEADGVDEVVERDGVDGEDVVEGKAWGGELGLQTAHGEGVGGVFSLGGEHEGDEGLKAFVLDRGC